jgi:hypothetical protein
MKVCFIKIYQATGKDFAAASQKIQAAIDGKALEDLLAKEVWAADDADDSAELCDYEQVHGPIHSRRRVFIRRH